MNKEMAKQYLHEFLNVPGIINLDEEDLHFFLGKEGSTNCYYGFGTATAGQGLMAAVNAACADLRKSFSGKPDGVLLTIRGNACLADVNEAANCVADYLCSETTVMGLGFVAAEEEESLELMIAVAIKK